MRQEIAKYIGFFNQITEINQTSQLKIKYSFIQKNGPWRYWAKKGKKLTGQR